MKNKVKIPVIVVSSVVGAILIAVIILCCITVRPLSDFKDYKTVRIGIASGTLPDETVMNTYKKKLDKNLEDTGFSVMHATLEFVGSYGPEFIKVKNEDGDKVNKELTIVEARAAVAASAESYKLEFEYGSVKEYKVKGETVKYDRMMMNVKTTDGELRWVTLYLYLSEMDGTANPEAEEYRVTPVRLRMNTSPLYNALGEIARDFV